jgi:transposase
MEWRCSWLLLEIIVSIRFMVSAADELHLRLLYRRIAELAAAAVSLEQQRQAIAVRNRVTAELGRRGWRVPEIAAALGASNHRVRHWHDQGRKLEVGGLSLPYPSAGEPASFGPSRLSVTQVAERLQVDGSTVRRWIKHGRLPAARASTAKRGPWVVEVDDLKRLGAGRASVITRRTAQRHRSISRA